MGCDIHVFVEKRVKDRWVMVHEAVEAENRNYERFAQLAGVRGSGPKPKGLPLDISDSTNLQADRWGVDGHSHSWLYLPEAMQIWQRTEYNQNSFNYKYPYYYFGLDEVADAEEYRIVFWFDN